MQWPSVNVLIPILCNLRMSLELSQFYFICQGASGSGGTKDDVEDNTDDSLFSFPRQYDKSYCISFSVMTDDIAYRLRQLQQRREDEGKRSM